MSIHDARKGIEATLAGYGISWKVETTGQSVFTAKCTLHDDSGALLDSGYGKGDIDAAIAGSIFEAAEHWFCQFSNCRKDNLHYGESSQHMERHAFADLLPVSLLHDAPNATMAFRCYTRIGCSEERLYPLALSNPKYVDGLFGDHSLHFPDSFDYSRLGSYCSNSGVAIGSDLTEATIHGLLEAVERDTFSKFLVDAFLKRRASALRVVDRNSLPEDLFNLIRQVEREVSYPVLLLEFENEFGIPVFFAALQKSSFEIEVTGYGCSLSNEHAAKRSLHELVQCYHAMTWFHPEEFKKKEQRALANLANHSFHLRCAKLKVAECCEEIGFTSVNFSETAFIDAPLELCEYLRILVQHVERSGRRAYSAVVRRLNGGEVITHSFFEGQDHFFCVTNGTFVLPNLKAT